MTKIDELTDEELDVLVAEKVMEWVCDDYIWYHDDKRFTGWYRMVHGFSCWQPSTNASCASLVDKPEWEWELIEHLPQKLLSVHIWLHGQDKSVRVAVPLDPDNKVPAHCRGRILCALLACGVEEV